MNNRIILGIDPGTNYMGFGIIDASSGKPALVDLGVLDMKKGHDPYEKLKTIFDYTSQIILNYSPTEFAIEAQFYGKNVQSMLKLGRAQGVSIAAAMEHKLPIAEYAPLKIKQAITGNGMASKEQVAAMLRQYLHMTKKEMPEQLDATDAVAVALCHYFETNKLSSAAKGKRFGSWADFAKENKQRISNGR